MNIWNIDYDDDYDGDWSDENEKMSIDEVDEVELDEVELDEKW